MPVIGHAFVGLVTAREFGPPRADRRGALMNALWLPVVMTLAYWPDLVTQVGSLAGWPTANLVGHSVPIGVAVGSAFGMAWARLARTPAPLLVAVSIGSI